MASIMSADQSVAWLECSQSDGCDGLESNLLRLLQVILNDAPEDNDRPKKKSRLDEAVQGSVSTDESSQRRDRLVVLSSSTLRVTTSINAASRTWIVLEHVSAQPLPITLTEPIVQQDPSRGDRLAVEVNMYSPCIGNMLFGRLQIHNACPDLVLLLQMMNKAQLPFKQTCKKLKSHTDYWRQYAESAAIPKVFLRQSNDKEKLFLDLLLTWKDGMSCLDVPKSILKRTTEILDAFTAAQAEPWCPQDFYENVHTPAPDEEVWDRLWNDLLICDLYPFQKRTVRYMLQREGAKIRNGMIVSPKSGEDTSPSMAISCLRHEPKKNAARVPSDPFQISRTLGKICSGEAELPHIEFPRGGILAEEMGLGKTVELIALISYHRRRLHDLIQPPGPEKEIISSAATLIITPPHLIQQWEDELKLHAPHLSVCLYGGVATMGETSLTDLAEFNVVLTTYAVIGREIWYADAQPKRNLRHARKYSCPTSALVQIEWWRVCLDEAQMVESALTNTAIVARLIPRVNAWAVSGTPFKNHVTDLFGLLTFLKFAPFSDRTVWARVDRTTFNQIFSTIAIRHTKDKVRNELQLPPQKRFVMTFPFLAIEEQHYRQIFEEMCTDCGFNRDGTPKEGDMNNYAQLRIEKMRTWLRRLRQQCLYPQVAGRHRKTLGSGKDMPLRTVEEVLRLMIDQNENSLRASERSIVSSKVQIGHLHAFDGSCDERSQRSLIHYNRALELIAPVVAECRAAYNAIVAPDQNGIECETEEDKNGISDKTREQQQKTVNLRKALELYHVCEFFVGTAHYQMKENDKLTQKGSDEYRRLEALETQHYDKAKAIRLEILREPREKAEHSMKQVRALEQLPLHIFGMPDHGGGIENVKIMDKLQNTSDKLNQQIPLIMKWRGRIHKILLKSLVDNDDKDEQTGEEYEDSTKEQDELYVLFLVLRTIAADRCTFITGYVNPLIEHEAKQALKQAQKSDLEDRGPAPELMIECLRNLREIRPATGAASLRGVLADLRSLLTQLEWQLGQANIGIAKTRITSEMAIVQQHMSYIQQACVIQNETIQGLEKELDLFRITMNHRLSFYKELQRLSDMVQPPQESLDESFAELSCTVWLNHEERATKALAGFRTKRRFFEHLRQESDQEVQRMCVICQSGFENGVLTICGHQYCKFCIQEWWTEHRTCPLCKRYLELEDFHDITYKPREIVTIEEALSKRPNGVASVIEPQKPSVETAIYAAISVDSLNQIKSIDLPTSFGTKLDTLARHLIWLRSSDPGAKSIIFSQFNEFLETLEMVLARCQIQFTSIYRKGSVEKFRRNPSVECFLLDAKSDSSGLNLVNATHVFLCEPLVNPAIELQAIARVHRIGQMRTTTVWMSLIQDTVEEAVYNLSVGRRLDHVAQQIQDSKERPAAGSSAEQQQKQQNDVAIDAANSAELQRVTVSQLIGKGSNRGGELVAQKDLWTCLFSKAYATHRVNDSLVEEMNRHYRADAAERRRGDTLAELDANVASSQSWSATTL